MGKRGTKPKSKRELQASDSWRAGKRGDAPKTRAMTDLEPPPWLCDGAQGWWRHNIEDVVEQVGIKELDRTAFASAAECHAAIVDCSQTLQQEGRFVRNRFDVPSQHPASIQLASMLDKYIKLSARFGLTPLDRDGLSVPAESSEDPEVAKLFEKGA